MTASYQEACTLLETRRFDVVLSETELADGNAYGLICTVTASPTNCSSAWPRRIATGGYPLSRRVGSPWEQLGSQVLPAVRGRLPAASDPARGGRFIVRHLLLSV